MRSPRNDCIAAAFTAEIPPATTESSGYRGSKKCIRKNHPFFKISVAFFSLIDTGKTLRSKAIKSDSELFAIVLALFNSSKFKPVEVIFKIDKALLSSC